MFREIKYRLIFKGKVVGYEFVYNMESCKDEPVNLSWGYEDLEGRLSGGLTHDHKDPYTGLKDKNKVEICEGDIVKHIRHVYYPGEDKDFTITRIGVAVLSGSSGLFFKGLKFVIDHLESDQVDPSQNGVKWRGKLTCLETYSEIVSTIHKNPELLKE